VAGELPRITQRDEPSRTAPLTAHEAREEGIPEAPIAEFRAERAEAKRQHVIHCTRKKHKGPAGESLPFRAAGAAFGASLFNCDAPICSTLKFNCLSSAGQAQRGRACLP